jgi:glycerol-3-phosphate responsive antiterminator
VENQTWRERTQNASKITLCVAASREFSGRWVLQPIIATGIISIKDKVLRRRFLHQMILSQRLIRLDDH